jgi:TPR repeat protein
MRPALFRVMLTAWLMSVAIPGVAIGGPFEDASAAFTRGDYATALGLLRPLAEQGLAKAQYALGAMYDHGWGVPQNYAEALKWYRLAADQGDVLAQNSLAKPPTRA